MSQISNRFLPYFQCLHFPQRLMVLFHISLVDDQLFLLQAWRGAADTVDATPVAIVGGKMTAPSTDLLEDCRYSSQGNDTKILTISF